MFRRHWLATATPCGAEVRDHGTPGRARRRPEAWTHGGVDVDDVLINSTQSRGRGTDTVEAGQTDVNIIDI
jgi:hypothetical protein